MELDAKQKIFRKGMTVLDLGCCPGSWMQYAADQVGPTGTCIGIDLQETELIEKDNVHLHCADITDVAAVQSILDGHGLRTVDSIISDLAPKTSGVRDVDQWRSIELSEAVLDIAKKSLKPKGICIVKVLRGADFDDFYANCKRNWTQVKIQHCKASRDRSRELYLLVQSPYVGPEERS